MQSEIRTGWTSTVSRVALCALVVETVTGLLITVAPFHAAVEWTVLAHSALGLLLVVPIALYTYLHWSDYRHYRFSDSVLLGYLASAALLVCTLSGLVVTWQGLFGPRMSPAWRDVHLYSTFTLLGTTLPHIALVYLRLGKRRSPARAGWLASLTLISTAVVALLIAALSWIYDGADYTNELPEDYNYVYGEDRPFAPSLALTSTGGGFDPESLAGSESCGTNGCHAQILEEWKPSAHRYAAMDPLFQKVQSVMAEQNGPESTRYCAGCHDPISLFSGAKNIFVENLTELHGYQEGISCLACHGIRETDLQGNANYTMGQPSTYLWQWSRGGPRKFLSDFLIRTYPDEHNKLSKRMYKAPEYCAACHKQFIDEEVNRVGWVQLQNQYDNWKASHWFVEGSPEESVECRECHMPLVASTDPARGDATDHNRTPADGKHRSHRFIASNSLVPALLELEGWQEQVELTELWLQGRFEIPEIADKWRVGPVVEMTLQVPTTIAPGEQLPIRVILTANKVGHDFPTGPLDIIQSWVEMHVFDPNGREIFSTGTRDENNFLVPGTFLFKAEPVDQHGNLIDRHNLWEMVGVRYRRALFPGYSDTVEYMVDCPSAVAPLSETEREAWRDQRFALPAPAADGELTIEARLMYRKVDQFLINFLIGEDSGLTAPVIEMTRTTARVPIKTQAAVLDSTEDPSIDAGG